MQKLQATTEAVFADINLKPRPGAPSNTAVLRDRRLAEVANKIQKLKEARLQARSRE
jgi:hypothetical protein